MRYALLLFILLAASSCQAVAAEEDGGATYSGVAGGFMFLASLQRLQRLVMQARQDVDTDQTAAMVKLAREVVKGVVKRAENSQPSVRVATNILEWLNRAAAAAAPVPVHHGQMMVERAKLLNAMGRADTAQELADAAAHVFHAELAAWVDRPEAGTPSSAGAGQAREQAAAALGSLLDVAALWRQQGREEEANAVAAEALEAAQGCMAFLEWEVASAAPSTVEQQQQAEGGPAAVDALAAAAEQQPQTVGAPASDDAVAVATDAVSGCSWIKIKRAGVNETEPVEPVPDMHRLYYAAHRGLHARKRYGESWAALARAKALHYAKHTYKLRDFERMVDEMAELFPSPLKFGDAVAEEQQAEEVDALAPSKLPSVRTAAQVPDLIGKSSAWLQRMVTRLSTQGRMPQEAPSGGAAGEGETPGLAASNGSAAGRAGGGSRGSRSSSCNSGAASSDSSTSDSEGEMIPIFVMGLPRSGSTLAEQILSSHPEVYGAGEHSSLRTVTGRLQDLIKGNGTVTPAQLTQLRRHYLSTMRAKIPPEYHGARWVVDKALSNAWLVGHIALMMPCACLVHAVRHPGDAALSSFQQSFIPEKVPWSFNLTSVAAHVKAHHRLMALWDRLLPGRVLHLHYAHMVTDQEGTTRRLVQHCGLPWDPAFLRFYENKRSVQTASQLQVKKPIYSSSLSKWTVYKERLAPLLVELRDTILTYEQAAGLPSSQAILDQLQEQLAAQQQQQQQEGAREGEAVQQEQEQQAQEEGMEESLASEGVHSTAGAMAKADATAGEEGEAKGSGEAGGSTEAGLEDWGEL